MKRISTLLILVSVLLSLFSVTAFAQEEDAPAPTNVPRAPGLCGESVSWTFDQQTDFLIGLIILCFRILDGKAG